MKQSEQLAQVRRVIETVNTKVGHGTAANPKLSARIDLAYDRAVDCAGGGTLPGPTTGGTSSPQADEERNEAQRVKREAERDARTIEELVSMMRTAALKIERIVDRQTGTIHPSKLPTNALPGCRACARKELDGDVTIGGHFEHVYADGLCRPCWDFKSATGGLPPTKWCHLRHTQGKKAPNLWLAKAFPKLLESVQRKKPKGEDHAAVALVGPEDVLPQCATTWWHHGVDLRCSRPQGHEPASPAGCRGVLEGKSVPFPIEVTA